MSTRSCIAAKFSDGSIKAVYCHFDGYVSGVGATLKNHFKDQQKIETLINLGSLCSLDPSIEKPEGHCWDHPVDGYTIAYHRDRGEDLVIEEIKVEENSTAADIFNVLRKVFEYVNFWYFWDGVSWQYMRSSDIFYGDYSVKSL